MLEVLYDIATKEVRAWNADMSVKGHFKPKDGQRVYTFPIDPPDFESDIYYVDFKAKKVIGNPDYKPPAPPRDLAAEVNKIKDRIIMLDDIVTRGVK